jgi:hypothetical protein
MKRISDLLGKAEKQVAEGKKSRNTERGELMRFFVRHLNYSRATDGLKPLTMARMGKILQGIPTSDLYYLKTMCSKAKNFSKKFWWEVDPEKHLEKEPF